MGRSGQLKRISSKVLKPLETDGQSFYVPPTAPHSVTIKETSTCDQGS